MHDITLNADGTPRMLWVGEDELLPWHSLGKQYLKPPSLEEVKRLLQATPNKVNVHPLFDVNGKRMSGMSYTMDDENNVLGYVGPTYKVLQDDIFIDSLTPWIDGGFGEIHTAMQLRGGARTVVQVKLNREPIDIEKDDPIQMFAFIAHGHDGKLGITGGRNDVRIVCHNTLLAAFKAGGIIKKKHRGNVEGALDDIHTTMLKWEQEFLTEVEQFRFLASVAVADDKAVETYVKKVFKPTAEKEDKVSKHLFERIAERFESGIGNNGENYWHLLNAVTEDTTHYLGNTRQADVEGTQEMRRLNSLWFGESASINKRAVKVALQMAAA